MAYSALALLVGR